uniref:Uncharacterized protein n=1 Tax=Romanomermis culicivorax TaxID=13658 RepID=A0A915HYH0_ROMCU
MNFIGYSVKIVIEWAIFFVLLAECGIRKRNLFGPDCNHRCLKTQKNFFFTASRCECLDKHAIMLITCLAILMVFYQIGVDGECCSSEKLDFVCKYIPYGTAKKPEKFCCCKDCTKPANGGYT